MKISLTRGRVVRLGVAAVLFAGVASVGLGSAARADVIPNDNCEHKVPTGDSRLAISGIYTPNDTCIVRMERTLVFVGESILSKGVNFAGMGDNSAGGTFSFDGICVMVDWTAPTGTSTPSATKPVPCDFSTGYGNFFGPESKGNFVGQTLQGTEGKNINSGFPTTPNVNSTQLADKGSLNWDPDGQASCFNSSGNGQSSFTSKPASGLPETWTSTFEWKNSLNNFFGKITNGSITGDFNAKIRADASPASDLVKMDPNRASFTYFNPVDRTDVGCLDKTAHQLNESYDNVSHDLLGLRALLVSGTATWDIRAPGIN